MRFHEVQVRGRRGVIGREPNPDLHIWGEVSTLVNEVGRSATLTLGARVMRGELEIYPGSTRGDLTQARFALTCLEIARLLHPLEPALLEITAALAHSWQGGSILELLATAKVLQY